jgi:hypothetical protein
MRRFVLKILVAGAVFVALIVALFLVNRWGARFRVDPAARAVILGHSHPECAFDDALIPGVTNLAESGETYFWTLQKARKLIDQNPGVGVVLIEFSNSQIRAAVDEWIWEDNFLSYRLPTFAPVMDGASLGLLLRHNPRGVVEGIPFVSKRNINMVLRYRLDYVPTLGGFKRLDKILDLPAALRATTDSLHTVQVHGEPLSIENLDQLDLLIAYCLARGREVMFIRTPMHPQNPDLRNEALFQRVRTERYPDVEFLDFNAFPLADGEFADLGHLNATGAARFSAWFAALVEGGLLEIHDKQGFIDSKLASL